MVSYISKFAKKFFKFTKLLKQALAKIKVGCRWAKKSSLVSGNRQGENFFITYLLHIRLCIRIYIFCFKHKKHTQKQETKETKENRKTEKTNEEKENKNVADVNHICGKSS